VRAYDVCVHTSCTRQLFFAQIDQLVHSPQAPADTGALWRSLWQQVRANVLYALACHAPAMCDRMLTSCADNGHWRIEWQSVRVVWSFGWRL
jgi:hypothetical protein